MSKSILRVIGSMRHDAVQFHEQVRCDSRGGRVCHPVHHAMADRADGRETRMLR